MADAEQESQAAEGQAIEQDDFAALLDQNFRPKSPEVKSNVEACLLYTSPSPRDA